jgi:tetratricopeptide (TPR) repeat protein
MMLYRKPWFWMAVTLILACGSLAAVSPAASEPNLWPALDDPRPAPGLEIQHPIKGAVMPLNMPAPVLLWKTNAPGCASWSAAFTTGARKWLFDSIQPMWRPDDPAWRAIKQAAGPNSIELIIAGWDHSSPPKLKARASVAFTIDPQSLEAPLFYREVNLPFSEAVKDPSRIRWRFGSIADRSAPPIVLENLPVCGNCHSFSRDGGVLAMDVDYANSKGSYIMTKTSPEMRLATSDVITWDDFKKEDGRQTFGLLSQISPDGRFVLSTVKDRSVFVPRPNLAFSQLFFPLKGILAVYDREAKRFFPLPGADDPAFVQSNPTWSPDGQTVLFARNRAAELEKARDTGSVLLTPDECEEFLKGGKAFRYDLYRLPFNGGAGGKPEPLPGASGNGRSNYFPKYSPDSRWLVFCQASNYMLLQPDSELFIIPSAGGQARRLACNLGRMNSWHSWSPDGRWLVFSSKAHSDYTQLYLARMGDDGQASPPVWLAHMVSPGRAANIPEFVSLATNAILHIREQFLDDYSYTRAGNEFFRAGDADKAIERFTTALSLNPDNATAHQRLGFLLYHVKNQPAAGLEHTRAAVRLEPRNPFARFDLGQALLADHDLTNAVVHFAEAVRLLPNGYDRQYNAVEMNYVLAETYYQLDRFTEVIPHLDAALSRAPADPKANFLMAMTRAWLGETETTTSFYQQALRSSPDLAKFPDYFDLLSRNFLKLGGYTEGLAAAEKGAQLAANLGRSEQAARLRQRAEFCRSRR